MTHPQDTTSEVVGELVGEVVGFMHPTADWCSAHYSEISAHCQIGGPAPVALIRQSDAAAQLAALTKRVGELEGALEPFAGYELSSIAIVGDDEKPPVLYRINLAVGSPQPEFEHFRRARSTLTREAPNE